MTLGDLMKTTRSAAKPRWLALPLAASLFLACSGSDSAETAAKVDEGGALDGASERAPDTKIDADAGAADVKDASADARADTGDAGGDVIDASSEELDAGVGNDGDATASGPPDPPDTLSATGLYSDIGSLTLASDVREYAPTYVLWSDGAVKTRWIKLPAGTQIDTSDMDHWSFPVGTKFWKEFRFGGNRVETRFINRWGPGEDDFIYAAYEWSAANPPLVPVYGEPNALDAGHDIPSRINCTNCHGYLKEHVLGFGAIQLTPRTPDADGGADANDGGGAEAGADAGSTSLITIQKLSAEGLLTVPSSSGFHVPGTPVEERALGYLHANCGNCHNDTGVLLPAPFAMRVLVGATTVDQTGAYQTAVNQNVAEFIHSSNPDVVYRIEGQNPTASCVVYRMSQRGNHDQMPPIATILPDPTGIDTVSQWIDTLPTP